MSSEVVIDVQGLTVVRGNTEVLSDIDWRVERGEHCVLLGANGSGKSTLLSALLTYVPARRGTLRVLGQQHGQSDWRKLRKKVGIVSTTVERLIDGHETAFDIVYSGMEATLGSWGEREPHLETKTEELLQQVECSYARARRFDVLSHGERQRVLIGRALVANPPLLILDEPCSGLDAAAREKFLAFLERLAKTPNAPTMVLVTHHVEEISPTFGHVLLLRRGAVLAAGKTNEVLSSAVISEALGAPMVLRQQGDRYSLALSEDSGHIV